MIAKARPTIIVAEVLEAWAMQRLSDAGNVVTPGQPPHPDLAALVPNADALIVRTRTIVDAALIAAGRNLKVIGRAGVGLDNIDLAAAERADIAVVHTPAAATESVADLTVALMLDALRSVARCDREVRDGRFEAARAQTLGRDLRELTLGIVGLGRIGRAVARRCHRGFDMRVLFADIRDPGWTDTPCERLALPELVGQADIISLHVPLTRATRGMVNALLLEKMRPWAILVNTARGPIVQSQDVADALRVDRLGAYAADVLDVEPPPRDHPLLSAPRVTLTPHIGARTRLAQSGMSSVVDDVLAILDGKAARFVASVEADG